MHDPKPDKDELPGAANQPLMPCKGLLPVGVPQPPLGLATECPTAAPSNMRVAAYVWPFPFKFLKLN